MLILTNQELLDLKNLTINQVNYQRNRPQKQAYGRKYYKANAEQEKARTRKRYQENREAILEQAKITNPEQFQKNKTQIMARRIIVKGSKPTNNHVAISIEILNRLLVSKQQ